MANDNYSEKVSVNMNSATLASIDLLVDNGFYSNRSDFINPALRDGLHNHQNTLDRIINEQTGGNTARGKKNPHHWFVGVYHFDCRALAEMKASGETGSITGYGVLAIDEKLEDAELFEAVESIKVKGKVICKKSVKEHYGLK